MNMKVVTTRTYTKKQSSTLLDTKVSSAKAFADMTGSEIT